MAFKFWRLNGLSNTFEGIIFGFSVNVAFFRVQKSVWFDCNLFCLSPSEKPRAATKRPSIRKCQCVCLCISLSVFLAWQYLLALSCDLRKAVAMNVIKRKIKCMWRRTPFFILNNVGSTCELTDMETSTLQLHKSAHPHHLNEKKHFNWIASLMSGIVLGHYAENSRPKQPQEST